MKNKKLFGVLSLLLATGLILTGCNKSNKESSGSEQPSSSEPAPVKQKFTVNFVVEGVTTYTCEVEDGGFATYPYDNPTKAPDAQSPKYRFRGWDNNIFAPITANTTFTAEFAEYAEEYVIDDFESYTNSAMVKDGGWHPITYGGSGWTTTTKATVSLSHNATQGSNALRFDAWENDVGFKFAKEIDGSSFTKSVNALQFSWMVPDINTVSILLYGTVTISGQTVSAYFNNKFQPKTSEYVQYTIPLNDSNWALYGESGKTIASVADWTGVHEDDILHYLTKIEFYIQGSNGGQPFVSFCDSIKFVTIDDPQHIEYEKINKYSCYTGYNENDNTVRIDIEENGNATLGIIDLETPLVYNGTVTENEDSFTFTSNELTYIGKKVNAGKAIKCLSVTGSIAEQIGKMELNAVQLVENFDQYTEDGLAYYQSNPKNNRSGCRGAYYSEYYSGNADDDTQWGGNKWSLMGGSGDQLKLMTDGGHSGNQYVSMKHSHDNAMRYMQWGLFDGSSDVNAFRGDTMSFWAKTSGAISEFKVYMYSQSTPDNSTKDSYVRSDTFSETSAVGEWKHYEIGLDPSAVYYGFCVLIQPKSEPQSFLYIDDVEVYTASPYATYVPPEPLSVPKNVSYVAKVNNDLVKVALEPRTSNRGQLKIPGTTAKTFYYSLTDDTFEITVGGAAAFTYRGTMSQDQKTITFISVTGTDTQLVSMFNNVNFVMTEYADNAESYEDSGKMYYQGNRNERNISGARGAYYCEYEYSSGTTEVGGPGWLLMGGNGDQLNLDTSAGSPTTDWSKSLSMKASSNGRMRYMQWNLFKGKGKGSEGHTGFNKFGVYLNNTNDAELSLELSVYFAKKVNQDNVNSARVYKTITVEAHSGWQFYELNLDPTITYYGYSIVFDKLDSGSCFMNVDKAFYYNDYENPEVNYFAKKNLSLTGNVTEGAASLVFDNNGVVKFTCADAGITNASYTYFMKMANSSTQQMVIRISDQITVTGTYSVSSGGVVTFTVTAVTGDSPINVGASFSS